MLLPNEAAELEESKKAQEQKYNALAAKKEEGEAIDAAEIAEAGIKTGDEVEIEFRGRILANREELYKKVVYSLTSILFMILNLFILYYRHWKMLLRGELLSKLLPNDHISTSRHWMIACSPTGVNIWTWRNVSPPTPTHHVLLSCLNVAWLQLPTIQSSGYAMLSGWRLTVVWMKLELFLFVPQPFSCREGNFTRIGLHTSSVYLHVHCRADIHLEYALFQEVHGNVASAREIYENLSSIRKFLPFILSLIRLLIEFIVPGHVESTIRYVSFLRRQGKNEEACSVFETALSISSMDKSGPYLSIQYGLFLERVVAAPSRVRDVYDKTLQKFPEHKDLWMAYIQFESGQGDPEKVLALYSKAVAEHSKLTAEEKYDLWQSYVEYADYWASNPATVRKLHETYRTLYPAYAYKGETAKKRPLFDVHGNAVDGANPAKVQRTNGASTAAASAAAAAYAQPTAAAATAQYSYPYSAAQVIYLFNNIIFNYPTYYFIIWMIVNSFTNETYSMLDTQAIQQQDMQVTHTQPPQQPQQQQQAQQQQHSTTLQLQAMLLMVTLMATLNKRSIAVPLCFNKAVLCCTSCYLLHNCLITISLSYFQVLL